MALDRFSLCTVPITQLANHSPMASATAFVWKLNHQHYLITNWHVITGRNTQTGKLEAPARPDTLRALFNIRIGDFGKQQWDIKIRDDDGRPLWLVHPNGGRIDVVVLPLRMSGDDPVMDMCPINSYTSKPLRIQIGMEVFILGYPFGAAPPAFPYGSGGQLLLSLT
jgi:hypothetical protein